MQVGRVLPSFVGSSSEGLVSLHDAVDGLWSVVFALPGPYDPVTTTVSAAAFCNASPSPLVGVQPRARATTHAWSMCVTCGNA